MKPVRLTTLAIAVQAVLSLSGCAVTHGEANRRAELVKQEMDRETEKQKPYLQPEKNPLYKRIHAVYIGDKSAPIARNAALPPAVNNLSFQLPRRTNLATAAKNISALSKYPVRINPDVYLKTAPGLDTTAAAGKGSDTMVSNLLSSTVPDMDTSLPTDFDGPLKDYLDIIAGNLNINWEFDPAKGFYFYRYVTKVLEVKLHAGDNTTSTNITKGTQASTGSKSTGAGAGAGSDSSGAYSSNTSVKTGANYSPWAMLENGIKAVLTPQGKIAVDISSNSIIVRDTRDAVDEAERIVMRANEVHNRLVTLALRVMRVSYDDSSAASASFQAAYSRILGGGGKDYQVTLNSPGTLVSGADAGGIGFAVLNPASRWSGSTELLQAINNLGTIVSDQTQSYPVMNRRTVPVASFDTDTYLAQTTPASGGFGGTTSGVPGLVPGTLTTGFFLSMTPTAYDDGTVWLDMTIDQSEKRGPFGTASTGAGDTFQQIQLPNTHVDTKTSTVAVKAGETLMLVNMNNNNITHSNRTGLLGTSGSGERRREMQVILVTPYVRTL